jgi:hypothetical protein
MDDLHDSVDVRREVNLCWLPTTPEQVLAALWARPDRLASAAPHLSEADRLALLRSPDDPWTVADVPLLDELAELLGDDDSAARAAALRRASERAEEVRYAQGVLGTSAAAGLVSPEVLADRFGASEVVESVAERAAGDRDWAYGHVVVDEAQELSPMAWRLLLRRCPSGSMTAVGDPVQASSSAGPASWGQVLDVLAAGRWELAELTVNYRTPAEVMGLASGVLQRLGVASAPPRSARSGSPPVVVTVPSMDAAAVERVVSAEWEVLGAGRLAVVTPRDGFDELSAELRARVAPATVDGGAHSLDAAVVVLDVGQVKGLEFDSVVVVEPSLVLAQSSKGAGDLYVALTRCTQRLTVVHSLPLPDAMADALRSPAGDAEAPPEKPNSPHG